jgi:DNA adenine methylase
MIRYVGGKTRLAKEIAAIIQNQIKPKHKYYYEPFFGGGSMAAYTKDFGLSRIASDNHCELIHLYRLLESLFHQDTLDIDLLEQWFKNIDETEYNKLKQYSAGSFIQLARKAYAGFNLSFAGKYFGGYARDKAGKRDFAQESFNRMIKHIPDLRDIHFHCMDYREFFPITDYMIIYADPLVHLILIAFGKQCVIGIIEARLLLLVSMKHLMISR